MRKPYRKISSRTVYSNPYLEVRVDTIRLPNGNIYEQAYFVKPNQYSTGIVAIDGKYIYLVKQLRYTAGQWMWQIPMGTTHQGNMLASAKKELKEETGLIAHRWRKLGSIRPEPGMTPQLTHIYLAQEFKEGGQEPEDTEIGIKVGKFTLDKMNQMIAEGKITCGYTLSAWQLYQVSAHQK